MGAEGIKSGFEKANMKKKFVVCFLGGRGAC